MEVLDELKSTTLLSYSNKAANQLAFKGDGSKKAQKRATGVKRAAGQLTMKAINKEEVVHEGDVHSGQGEKIVARTKKWMDKKGQKGAPGLDAMKARSAEHKAKRGVKEEVVDEAKVEKGYISNLSKAQARNERRFGKKGSTTPQGYFGQKPSQAAELSAKRTAEHKARRGVKEEVVTELNRYGKETGKATGSINKRAGTPVKKGGSTDKVLNYVRTKIRKETGKPEGQQKKVKGEKGRAQYGDRRGTPADTIAKRRQSRADAEKLMRDTSGT